MHREVTEAFGEVDVVRLGDRVGVGLGQLARADVEGVDVAPPVEVRLEADGVADRAEGDRRLGGARVGEAGGLVVGRVEQCEADRASHDTEGRGVALDEHSEHASQASTPVRLKMTIAA